MCMTVMLSCVLLQITKKAIRVLALSLCQSKNVTQYAAVSYVI